jgi:FdhD protein
LKHYWIRLRGNARQDVFKCTSRLHAAALFDAQGKLRALREGVGGTMPMDKLNGWTILSDGLPLQDHIILLSGRASFELLQKAIMARAQIVCAI